MTHLTYNYVLYLFVCDNYLCAQRYCGVTLGHHKLLTMSSLSFLVTELQVCCWILFLVMLTQL